MEIRRLAGAVGAIALGVVGLVSTGASVEASIIKLGSLPPGLTLTSSYAKMTDMPCSGAAPCAALNRKDNMPSPPGFAYGLYKSRDGSRNSAGFESSKQVAYTVPSVFAVQPVFEAMSAQHGIHSWNFSVDGLTSISFKGLGGATLSDSSSGGVNGSPGSGGGAGKVSFAPTPVTLPAAGFMLIGALGGLGGFRVLARRKRA